MADLSTRVTQLAVEVLTEEDADPKHTRVTQLAIEVINWYPNPLVAPVNRVNADMESELPPSEFGSNENRVNGLIVADYVEVLNSSINRLEKEPSEPDLLESSINRVGFDGFVADLIEFESSINRISAELYSGSDLISSVNRMGLDAYAYKYEPLHLISSVNRVNAEMEDGSILNSSINRVNAVISESEQLISTINRLMADIIVSDSYEYLVSLVNRANLYAVERTLLLAEFESPINRINIVNEQVDVATTSIVGTQYLLKNYREF